MKGPRNYFKLFLTLDLTEPKHLHSEMIWLDGWAAYELEDYRSPIANQIQDWVKDNPSWIISFQDGRNKLDFDYFLRIANDILALWWPDSLSPKWGDAEREVEELIQAMDQKDRDTAAARRQDMLESLGKLCQKFDIPSYRVKDYKWLKAHLAERNSQKPNFQKALTIVEELCRMG